MRKSLSILAIIVIIAMCFTFPIQSFAAGFPSVWAETEVAVAISLGIVPDELQEEYTANITRQEFAQTAMYYLAASQNLPISDFVAVYTEKAGLLNGEIFEIKASFSDTGDYYIDLAYSLGVVNGRGDGTFDPDGFITRQEAAVMLLNTYNVFGMYKPQEKAFLFKDTFADSDTISDWAMESAGGMYQFGVMNGVSDDIWKPLGNYTREQCFATFLRLYNNSPERTILLPYDEALERAITQGHSSPSYDIEYIVETDYCTVLVRTLGGLPLGSTFDILLIYKPNAPIYRGGYRFLPMPNFGYNYRKQPDKLWLSEDELTLFYSYHFDEPLTTPVYPQGEETPEGAYEVIREPGTYSYTVDLESGFVTILINGLHG